MSEAWRVASITGVEQIPVGSTALIRVFAVSHGELDPRTPRPELVVDDGYGIHRFAALAAPPDHAGDLRCGFSVPLELTGPHTVLSLELEDGNVIALPAPEETLPLPVAWAEDAPEEPEDPPGDPDDLSEAGWRGDEDPGEVGDDGFADDDASGEDAFADDAFEDDAEAASADPLLDLLLDVAEARAELSAARELSALRAPAPPPRPAGGDPAGELVELQVWSDELERRLGEATTALDDARVFAESRQAEVQELRAELAAARGEEFAPADAALSRLADDALAQASERAERELADAGG